MLVIGGAYSVDKYYRVSMGWNWFASEQPDEKIKSDVESALEQVHWKVDAVFSHTCPYNYMPTHLFLIKLHIKIKVCKNTELPPLFAGNGGYFFRLTYNCSAVRMQYLTSHIRRVLRCQKYIARRNFTGFSCSHHWNL